MGLDSSPSEAKEIFLKLLQNHPEDREVQLNYAESLIWNKDYEAAEHYYAEMIQENEPDFKLMLGYANSLSNLKNTARPRNGSKRRSSYKLMIRAHSTA